MLLNTEHKFNISNSFLTLCFAFKHSSENKKARIKKRICTLHISRPSFAKRVNSNLRQGLKAQKTGIAFDFRGAKTIIGLSWV